MSLKIIDKKELRQVLGTFVTGVTVITTVDADGKPFGLTVNSFSSVSLDPPLVLWNQSLTAPSYPVFRDAGRFAINILSESQIDVSRRFSTMGADKFANTPHSPGIGSVPLLDGCSAYIECSTESTLPGGDHTIFIGRVEGIRWVGSRPLAFGGGKYLVARPHELGDFSADFDGDSPSRFHQHAVPLAIETADELACGLKQAVALAVWGNHGPTVIHWHQPQMAPGMNLQPGFVMPVASSATGLAFAAHLPHAITEKPLRAERGWPDGLGLAQDAELDRTLADVKRRGMARVVDSHAFADIYGGAINALSAPVFDRDSRMAMALTVLGNVGQLDVEWGGAPARALAKAAAVLSVRLGHSIDA